MNYFQDIIQDIKKFDVSNQILPVFTYRLLGLCRIQDFIPYRNALWDINTNSSTKTSILSLNDENFQNISQILDNINMTYERYIVDKQVEDRKKDLKDKFHSKLTGTFNEEIFYFYKTCIMFLYLFETKFFNAFEDIREILNAGEENY